jgi:hypothetical protein
VIKLSDQWKALILQAWQDELDMSQWLPAVVSAIKNTRSNAECETALFTLLLSPLGRGDGARLISPAIVQPAYQLADDYADGAMRPRDKRTNEALAAISAIARENQLALTPAQILSALERMPKSPIVGDQKDAAERKGRRARSRLGVSRRAGRPKKADTLA